MNQIEFLEKVKKIANKDTSFDPDNWTIENPLWGHCVIVSLLAQDYFGGTLVRGSLEKMPKLSHLRSHYWNRLENGEEIDFTREQFEEDIVFNDTEIRTRESVLCSLSTQKRYLTLKARLMS